MNFLNNEESPEFMQQNITPKISKINIQFSLDKYKLPTKSIDNNLNNKYSINTPAVNTTYETKKNFITNNDTKNNKTSYDTNFSQDENYDYNNLFTKNINQEKSKTDNQPLISNYNYSSSISKVLFNKPAPLNFTMPKNLSKSCIRLNKFNEISKTAFPHFPNEHKKFQIEKNFDAYSNCDIELRNLNHRKSSLGEVEDFNDNENGAYGFNNDINRNYKGEMKFNLEEIDNFLNNENGNNNNMNSSRLRLKSINSPSNGNNDNNNLYQDDHKIEEAINKEMKFIKKMSLELRRIDTLSTSDIQDKDGPAFYSESDLLRKINNIKNQVNF